MIERVNVFELSLDFSSQINTAGELLKATMHTPMNDTNKARFEEVHLHKSKTGTSAQTAISSLQKR